MSIGCYRVDLRKHFLDIDRWKYYFSAAIVSAHSDGTKKRAGPSGPARCGIAQRAAFAQYEPSGYANSSMDAECISAE
ncbi:hypothetical protein GCM10010403_17620 [Glycomyces rutgersensis]|uniref:Uncharacterized protein n=2 Tax=Glycomyces TaxID=58113 RepID=A0ABU2AUW4_9ACTN|nr:hypothetical protein [Glycomyces lechevalierae]